MLDGRIYEQVKDYPGVTVSDGAGNLPGGPQHLQPDPEQLEWGKSLNPPAQQLL